LTADSELLLDTPATRPCTHPRANHQHGYLARYTLDRCRCLPCREAQRAYARHRREEMKHGRWAAYIDPAEARAHIRDLMRAGLSWKNVAERADLNQSTVERILYGAPPHWVPQKRIREDTARKLLAVTYGRQKAAAETPDLFAKEALNGP
jgi:hypothetical protein